MITTLLPESGTGFRTFNRGTNGLNQYGTARTIRLIELLGESWGKNNPPISIGHISRKGGGTFPPHLSHKTGLDIDIRPFRTDGANAPVTIYNGLYDAKLTEQLVRMIRQTMPVKLILFNDARLVSLGLTKRYSGHDNHLHVRLIG